MRYLSDVNLRAVLSVLVDRAGGTVDITNGELYDAMLPDERHGERFRVAETEAGIRVYREPMSEDREDREDRGQHHG